MAILFEPVGAAILAYYFLQEKMIWTQVIGGIIVIGGILFFLIDDKKIRLKNEASRAMINESTK
jgi:drug/metabolite transporter (DMT)-like permease